MSPASAACFWEYDHDRDEAQFSQAGAGLVVLAKARAVAEAARVTSVISPRVGEMPGRAEVGAVPPAYPANHNALSLFPAESL